MAGGGAEGLETLAREHVDLIISDMRMPLPYPHANRFVNFVRGILGEEKLCVSHDESLKVQRIIDACAHRPMTVFATPDGVPFLAGTYDVNGMPVVHSRA